MYVLYTVKTATCLFGVCRALCGFLNTGEGGAVYIGVGDNGRVLGLTYTSEQIDHMIQSISHTLSLYSPPVRRELWDVSIMFAHYFQQTIFMYLPLMLCCSSYCMLLLITY